MPVAPAAPFSFSFSLDKTVNKPAVATYNLAAPVEASDVQPSPVATVVKGFDGPASRKISRPKRGKERPSHEAEDGAQWEGDVEEGEDDGAYSAGEGLSSTAAHPFASAAPALSFDSSKFDLSSFHMSLPEAAPNPTRSMVPTKDSIETAPPASRLTPEAMN